MSAELVEHEHARKVISWQDRARSITIADQRGYETAASLLLDIAALEKEIVAHHKPIKESAFTAHRTACAAEKKLLDPLQEATGILKRGLGAFLHAQEQLRLEAERKARAEAARQEEELRLEQAQIAQDMGASAEAVEEIVSTPLAMPEPVAPRTFTPVAGVSARENWSAEVTDIKALCRAIADGKESPTLVLPNGTILNQMARALKGTLSIPGVRAVKQTGIAARTR